MKNLSFHCQHTLTQKICIDTFFLTQEFFLPYFTNLYYYYYYYYYYCVGKDLSSCKKVWT